MPSTPTNSSPQSSDTQLSPTPRPQTQSDNQANAGFPCRNRQVEKSHIRVPHQQDGRRGPSVEPSSFVGVTITGTNLLELRTAPPNPPRCTRPGTGDPVLPRVPGPGWRRWAVEVNGTLWGTQPAGQTVAGGSVAGQCHLVDVSETTDAGGCSGPGIPRGWALPPFSPLRSVTLRTRASNGVLLDVAGYQRAQPSHFKPGRNIIPPKKELLLDEPPPQRWHVHHPLSKGVTPPPSLMPRAPRTGHL